MPQPVNKDLNRNNARATRLARWLKTDGVLLLACLLVGSVVSVLRGQDNWWDIINYHIYNPWAILNGRWSKDLFVAGIQGYFHPLLDIPYYLLSMVWLPGHPRLVAALAGWPYGFLIFTTLLIVRHLVGYIGNIGRIERYAATLLIVLLSVTGVSAWTQAGTTTNEVTVATIVLLAVYVFISSAERDGGRKTSAARLLSMGALLGVAAGFKLTAAIYAPAMGLLLLAQGPDVRAAIRSGFLYSLGWLLAFAPLYGPWAWHLIEYTGNPMFPMFNNVFHSSFSAAVGGMDPIGMPDNMAQWFFYPFFWLDLKNPTVYNNLPFRDARVLFFYIVGIAYFAGALVFALRRKKPVVPDSIRLVAAFCAISYLIWLFTFSMLRYAIVIEVLAPVAASVLLLCLLSSLQSRFRPMLRLGLLLALVSCLMAITVYPDVPRIPFSKRTYVTSTPVLADHALVILANEPMGLLAPMIQAVNTDAQFVGLPLCFARSQWCFEGFYNYGLGSKLRQAIASHMGPIYVASYSNRVPILPQLALFRVQVDRGACQVMTTNATANVSICRARYVPQSESLVEKQQTFKLDFVVEDLVEGGHVQAQWAVNGCTTTTDLGKLTVRWQMPMAPNGVYVYLRSPPSYEEQSFAAGGSTGSASSGLWVRARQTFVFKDKSGAVLARGTTRFVACEAQ